MKNTQFHERNDHRSTAEGVFRGLNDNSWKVMIPTVKNTGTNWVRWEEKVNGKELVGLSMGDVTDVKAGVISVEDARQVASLISQNFFHQFLEQGLCHADVHPGNFMLTPEGEIAILDRKNLLTFEVSERQFLFDLVIKSGTESSARITERVLDFFAPDLPTARRKEIMLILAEKVKGAASTSFDQLAADVLISIKEQGIDVPLKWILTMKNLLGLNRIAQWAGMGSLVESLFHSQSGMRKDQVVKEVFPDTAKKLGLKLELLRFV